MINRPDQTARKRPSPEGMRVVILEGEFTGNEGICLGTAPNGRWAVSPDCSDQILELKFEEEFVLLVDLSGEPSRN